MNDGTARRPAQKPPGPTPIDSAVPQPEAPQQAEAAVTPEPSGARISAAGAPQRVGSADRPARPASAVVRPVAGFGAPRPGVRQVTPAEPLPESVTRFLPPRGFLHDYVADAYPLTEAPATAHLIAALVVASALVGRKVRIAGWGHGSLYLNLWAAIVGPSRFSRKSTVVGMAERVILDVEAALRLPDDTTAAALIDMLVERDERIWLHNELAMLFAQCEAKWNIGMAQQLATLYDVPAVWEVARKGTASQSQVVSVSRPYVTLLGATTTAWLKEHLSEANVLGGLYGRFLYMPIPDLGADGRLLSIPPAADPTRYQRVLDQAKQLYSYLGTMSLAHVREPYDRWYSSHRAALYTLEDRDRLGSFWGRMETHCLKLAALHQLSLTTATSTVGADREFFIEPEALDLAIALVDHLKAQLVRLFRVELTATPLAAAQQKLIGIVRTANGEISRRDLQRKAGLAPKSFATVLLSLQQDERLIVNPAKTPAGQQTFIVRLGDV